MNVIEVKNLTVYYNANKALDNICLTVPEKAYLGIMGPNGGGKSTLLKAMLGLVKVTSGSVEILGKVGGVSGVGYVPQIAPIDRAFPISVVEVALTGFMKRLRPFYNYTKQEKLEANQQLERLGILHLANRQITELSGGEFQRMLVARALVSKPKLLLLDEPTASCDTASCDKIYEILADLNKTISIVLVTHDMLAISSKVKTIACLNQTLVYHGTPELDQPTVNKLYGCPVDLIAHGVPHRVLDEHQHGSCGHQHSSCGCEHGSCEQNQDKPNGEVTNV
ncbi:MAG: ABC transporter ATP-binding protein [Clostridia bacterium]